MAMIYHILPLAAAREQAARAKTERREPLEWQEIEK
jgi:hypothetical protein